METVKDFFYKNKQRITEDLINAPKTVIDGIKFLADLPEMDMPYMKEVGQAKLLTKMGYDVILLPRFANSFIEKSYGKDIQRGSFPDGLVILVNEKKYVEFKRVGLNNLTRSLNAKNGSDCIFVIVKEWISRQRLEKSVDKAIKNKYLSERNNIIFMSELDGQVHKKIGLNYAESSMRASGGEIGTNFPTRLTEGHAIPFSYLNYIKQKYLCKDESIFPYEAYKTENDKQNFLRKEVEDKNISLLLTCLRSGYGEPLVAEEKKFSGIGKVLRWEFPCFYENEKVRLRLTSTPEKDFDNIRLEAVTGKAEYDKKNMPSVIYANSGEMLSSNLDEGFLLKPVWFLKNCKPVIHSDLKSITEGFLEKVKAMHTEQQKSFEGEKPRQASFADRRAK